MRDLYAPGADTAGASFAQASASALRVCLAEDGGPKTIDRRPPSSVLRRTWLHCPRILPYPSTAIARSTLSCGLTLTCASAMTPCSSITKWLRVMPMYFLPYMLFSPQTP